jgi:hypothetical protein
MRDLKEAEAKLATQAQALLREAHARGKVAWITEAQNPFRNLQEYGRWVSRKEPLILPGEEPSVWVGVITTP